MKISGPWIEIKYRIQISSNSWFRIFSKFLDSNFSNITIRIRIQNFFWFFEFLIRIRIRIHSPGKYRVPYRYVNNIYIYNICVLKTRVKSMFNMVFGIRTWKIVGNVGLSFDNFCYWTVIYIHKSWLFHAWCLLDCVFTIQLTVSSAATQPKKKKKQKLLVSDWSKFTGLVWSARWI